MEFEQHRRKEVAELTKWVPGTDMTGISIGMADFQAGSPKEGDMIARNPKNHDDKWLIAEQYYLNNFEKL